MKFLVCTLLICGVSFSMGQLLENDPQGRACVPQSTFMDKEGCNRCTCTNDGARYACTKKFCTTIDAIQGDEPQRCTPGSRFKAADGCNWCTCSDDGKNSMCTLMACVGNPAAEYAPMPYRRKRDDNCVPKSTFTAPDGCNTCTCSENGKFAFCTRMECPPKQEATPYRRRRDSAIEVNAGVVCEPNTSFMIDCNVCVCPAHGRQLCCTQKSCIRFD